MLKAKCAIDWHALPRAHQIRIPIVYLRFTHDTISDVFSGCDRKNIQETAMMLWRAGDGWRDMGIPSLDVVLDAECRVWSLDNRRLASFRMFQSLVEFVVDWPCTIHLHHAKFRPSRALTTKNEGLGVKHLSRQERLAAS